MSSELFDSTPKVSPRRLNVLPIHEEKQEDGRAVRQGRFPSWLHRPLPKGGGLWKTSSVVQTHRLATVCEEAKCPNLLECYSKKTATFLVMGKECTRACGFCDIDFSKTPQPLQEDEPFRVASSVKELGLRHVVITMVSRDDLPDGGAEHLVAVIYAIRKENPGVAIEVLTSDLGGQEEAIEKVLQARPDVFNHNIETVRLLTPRVRHKATYERTLAVLRYAREHGPSAMSIKSGLMVGLGETQEQVHETLHDLLQAGCNIVTMGQYLQASRHKLQVKEFITPKQFERYAEYGRSIGIAQMYCGPFVRSSYHAGEVAQAASHGTDTQNTGDAIY